MNCADTPGGISMLDVIKWNFMPTASRAGSGNGSYGVFTATQRPENVLLWEGEPQKG